MCSEGLCAPKQPELIEQTLNFIKHDKNVRDQDVCSFVSELAGNVASKRRVKDFVKENFEQVGFGFILGSIANRYINDLTVFQTLLGQHTTQRSCLRACKSDSSLLFLRHLLVCFLWIVKHY